MGLKVWLPLTKDIHNQGVTNLTFTNTGATHSSTGGKIGGCYSFDGSDDRIWTTGLNISGDAVSLCCWFKRDSSYSNEGYIMSLNNGSGYADCEIGIDTEASTIIGVAGGTNCPYSCTHGVWHHVAVTYDKQNIRTYLDGALLGTVANTNSLTKPYFTIGARANGGNGGSGIAYPFKGQINDVRLYSYCLSPEEVKEISKGLVLHYPLERRGLGQENLLKAKPCASGRNWTALGNGVKIDWTSNYGDTYWYLNLADGVTLIQDNTYTLSFQCSGLGSNTVSFDWCNNHSYHCYLHNGYNTYTFQMPSTNITNPFFDDINYDVSLSDLRLWNFKLEVGDKATPYSPLSSDTLYSQIGLNSNIEYDGSGFQNNGTKTGTFTWTSDTPKYSVSTYFASGTKITSPTGMVTGSNPIFTCNFWYNAPTGTYTQYADMVTFNGSAQIRMETCNTTGTNPCWFNYPIGTSHGFGGITITNNVWHMYTLVCDGTNWKTYFDGELKSTTALSGTAWTPNGSVSLGDNGMLMRMSDFRIYATALSANDIKSLYQNEAFVDTNGTVYGAIR